MSKSELSEQKKTGHSFFLPEFKPDFTQEQKSWRPLHFLNLYRVLISGIFVSLIFSNIQISPFGVTHPELFQITSFAYLTGSLLIGITIRWRWPALWLQKHAHILFDFCAIILIIHASGGVKSGVGLLLLTPIAAISILSFGRSSIFFAAIVSLALFASQSYLKLTLDISPSYAQTGLLGGALFITALLTNYLVNKTEESVEIASQREVDLANMEQLTQFIMQRMQTAVIVVDYLGNVKLVNDTAINLLKLTNIESEQQANLYEYSLELGELFHTWKTEPDFHTKHITLEKDATELTVKFAVLSNKPDSGTVVFIEDNAELTQEAQQLKLASLGRLTASIAHELRNPLAAIRHAGELLSESPSLEKTDHRLTEIIEKQSIRVNDIIGTVLNLSRRQKAGQESINLFHWVQEYLAEYIQLPQERFYLKFESEDLEVLFDQQHLQQIFNNLIQNALRHTIEDNHHFRPVIISAGIDAMNKTPYLQVMNYGPRIPKEDFAQLFEPFFTTEATGTGLGLYIARELAVCNSAKLEYIDVKEGACFQLSFADPRRKN
ncbi:MAG: ATPase [gamma proteobacterium symbiont of Lucinoma myriamae]|nr:ATPase [gamma proteobacterium symbiont of Lucinoma myriamae]MCU7818767.1 ATPase [gamma proteobacterium symbiont of Lucinoma myriamae]MCU7831353.1 ATPase [gamma proteobacterium symbiont of Lucinoma myriamae]